MTHNGIAVEAVRGFTELLRATPQAGAVATSSGHRWKGGTAVDWQSGSVTVGTAHLDREHTVRVDLPKELGGSDHGPTPSELLSAAVGACAAQRFVELAALREITLYDLQVTVSAALDLRGTYQPGTVRPGLSELDITLTVRADADDGTLDDLLAAAVDTSPIVDTAVHGVAVRPAVRRAG